MVAPLSAITAAAATTHSPRAAIVGGSLGGLAAANALYQAGWRHIDVFERSNGPLHEKGSGLGYVNVPAWEALLSGSRKRMMRRNQRASRAQGSFYYGDLWKYLYQGLPENTVKFNKTIESLQVDVQQEDNVVVVDGKPYDMVILSDGGFSKLRTKYVLLDEDDDNNNTSSHFQREPEYAGYVVWRGSVSASLVPKHVLWNIQEGVYKNGIYDTIVLKMAKDNGEDVWTMGSFIATPEDHVDQYWNKAVDGTSRHVDDKDASLPSCFAVPDWFLNHFETYFDDVPGLVNLIDCMIQNGEIRAHPQYEFGRIERVHRGRVILLGDAAHMASPRTAVGAHTAIMDALALREAMEFTNNDIDAAIARYSRSGLRHAHELYARSRQVSKEFVLPSPATSIVENRS